MDPYDSPLRSPIVVPITHSPIPYSEPDRQIPGQVALEQILGGQVAQLVEVPRLVTISIDEGGFLRLMI